MGAWYIPHPSILLTSDSHHFLAPVVDSSSLATVQLTRIVVEGSAWDDQLRCILSFRLPSIEMSGLFSAGQLRPAACRSAGKDYLSPLHGSVPSSLDYCRTIPAVHQWPASSKYSPESDEGQIPLLVRSLVSGF